MQLQETSPPPARPATAAAAAAAGPRATPKGLDETHYQADIADHEWEWDLDTGG